MYNNESFDDYIRSILGYPNSNNMYMNGISNHDTISYDTSHNEELEACYPEIYKIVYPMISQRCSRVTNPVTKEMIDHMTDEIYSAIEVNQEINLNINLQNEITNNRKEVRNSVRENNTKKEVEKEARAEDRQFRNKDLNDLIRILIIRELLGKPGFSGNRPPRPSRPPFPGSRPPFPGGPGPGIPPIRPRDYGNDMDIYESY